MRVSGNKAISMTQQYQVAQASYTIAGIHDLAIGGGMHRVSGRAFDIYAFGIGFEALDDFAGSRPGPADHGSIAGARCCGGLYGLYRCYGYWCGRSGTRTRRGGYAAVQTQEIGRAHV